MAVDKLVDSTKLDNALDATADAIRAKTGDSNSITFDLANETGFASAVAAIPTGTTPTGTKEISITANGTTTHNVTDYANAEVTVNVPDALALACANELTSYHVAGNTLRQFMFRGATALTTLTFSDTPVAIGQQACSYSGLTSISVPAVSGHIKTSTFQACASLVYAVFKSFTGNFEINSLSQCTNLTTADIDRCARIAGNTFTSSSKLNTLVLRGSSITILASTNAFTGTPFASGGTGGDIYINHDLYLHLGDNSELDYKKASNWSAVDGYGTITWHDIKGSYYETHYADGSAV